MSDSSQRRRWRDEPNLAPIVERVLLLLSRDVYAMRDCCGWSQEQHANAAGLHPDTVLNIEKMRDDVRISTLVRLAAAADFTVDIRFRRQRPR